MNEDVVLPSDEAIVVTNEDGEGAPAPAPSPESMGDELE